MCGFVAGLLVDLVLGFDDVAAFFGGDGTPVGVAQDVVLAGAPAGRDPGEQDGGDVAGRGVVVPVGGHQPLVLRRELGVGSAGGVGGGEQRLAQQWVAGLGQAVLVVGLPGLGHLRDQAGVGADRGQAGEPVRVADPARDDAGGDRSDARGRRR